jgi:hypothetical protein
MSLTPLPSPRSTALHLDAFTYEDRSLIVPALADALDTCGCWVLERKAASASQLDLRFELQLRAALELYTALIGAGLELTRSTHLALTALCTVRKHQRRRLEPFRVVEVTLALSFLEDLDLSASLLPPAAAA